jgi:uncharacterized protein YpuA (DUF1002 family)
MENYNVELTEDQINGIMEKAEENLKEKVTDKELASTLQQLDTGTSWVLENMNLRNKANNIILAAVHHYPNNPICAISNDDLVTLALYVLNCLN